MPLKTACSDDILPPYASVRENYLILAPRSALTSQTAGFPLLTAERPSMGEHLQPTVSTLVAVLAGKC